MIGLEAAREVAVARSGLLARTRDPELAEIVACTTAKYDAFFGGISVITGRRQILLAVVGTDLAETRREDSFCQTTIQRPGETLIVPDATVDPRFRDLGTVTGDLHLRFYAGYPILDRDGHALGALCIGDREARHAPFDPTTLIVKALQVERLLR